MKKLILLLPLLYACKTSSHSNCDAYGSTIVFPPMHIHDREGNHWVCNEFPSDTLEINNNICILK